MPDEAPPPQESWEIQVEHSSYYRWLPVREEDVTEDMITVEATWPGFRMYREIVNEPTTTTTNVNVDSLREINTDRAAAGLSPRSDWSNLVRHLEDGPWPKHFPLESITSLTCRGCSPDVATRLQSHFVQEVAK